MTYLGLQYPEGFRSDHLTSWTIVIDANFMILSILKFLLFRSDLSTAAERGDLINAKENSWGLQITITASAGCIF